MSDDIVTQEAEIPEMPEIPEYNAKMVRRASRRGVFRVAIVVVLVLLLVFAVIDHSAGALARSHHPRDAAVKAVTATFLANPGYTPADFGPGQRGLMNFGVDRLGDYNAVTRIQQTDPLGNPVGAPSELRVHQPLFGSPSATDFIAPSRLEDAIRALRPSKDATRSVVRGLPESSAASVAVELVTPLHQAEFDSLAARFHLANGIDTSIFTPMHATLTETPGGPDAGTRPVVVPALQAPLVAVPAGETLPDTGSANRTTSIDQLRGFAATLHESDNNMLIDVGMAPENEIKAVAADGKIYGFTVLGLSPAEITTLLNRPEVQSMAIADAVLNTTTR